MTFWNTVWMSTFSYVLVGFTVCLFAADLGDFSYALRAAVFWPILLFRWFVKTLWSALFDGWTS